MYGQQSCIPISSVEPAYSDSSSCRLILTSQTALSRMKIGAHIFWNFSERGKKNQKICIPDHLIYLRTILTDVEFSRLIGFYVMKALILSGLRTWFILAKYCRNFYDIPFDRVGTSLPQPSVPIWLWLCYLVEIFNKDFTNIVKNRDIPRENQKVKWIKIR